ncbi:MAG: hypothetical protein U0X92_18715 [Anaerolineales bacterium]
MHPFPAADPLPIAGVAFVALNKLRGFFGFVMRDQRCEYRGNLGEILSVFSAASSIENRSSTKRVSY